MNDGLLNQASPKPRNKILYKLMAGKSCKEIALAVGIDYNDMKDLLYLRRHPAEGRGGVVRYTTHAVKLAAYFKALPQSVFPLSLYRHVVPLRVANVWERANQANTPFSEAVNLRDTVLLDSPEMLFELDRALRASFRLISPREEMALKLKFGLDGPPRTRKYIAKQFGVSEKYVSQMIGAALRRLKHPSRGLLLKPFWQDRMKIRAEVEGCGPSRKSNHAEQYETGMIPVVKRPLPPRQIASVPERYERFCAIKDAISDSCPKCRAGIPAFKGKGSYLHSNGRGRKSTPCLGSFWRKLLAEMRDVG